MHSKLNHTDFKLEIRGTHPVSRRPIFAPSDDNLRVIYRKQKSWEKRYFWVEFLRKYTPQPEVAESEEKANLRVDAEIAAWEAEERILRQPFIGPLNLHYSDMDWTCTDTRDPNYLTWLDPPKIDLTICGDVEKNPGPAGDSDYLVKDEVSVPVATAPAPPAVAQTNNAGLVVVNSSAAQVGPPPSQNKVVEQKPAWKPVDKSQPACYNCNEVGHFTKECTKPKKPDSRVCYNCQEPGHVSSECSKENRDKNVTCNKCKRKGHKSERCQQEERKANDKGTARNNRGNSASAVIAAAVQNDVSRENGERDARREREQDEREQVAALPTLNINVTGGTGPVAPAGPVQSAPKVSKLRENEPSEVGSTWTYIDPTDDILIKVCRPFVTVLALLGCCLRFYRNAINGISFGIGLIMLIAGCGSLLSQQRSHEMMTQRWAVESRAELDRWWWNHDVGLICRGVHFMEPRPMSDLLDRNMFDYWYTVESRFYMTRSHHLNTSFVMSRTWSNFFHNQFNETGDMRFPSIFYSVERKIVYPVYVRGAWIEEPANVSWVGPAIMFVRQALRVSIDWVNVARWALLGHVGLDSRYFEDYYRSECRDNTQDWHGVYYLSAAVSKFFIFAGWLMMLSSYIMYFSKGCLEKFPKIPRGWRTYVIVSNEKGENKDERHNVSTSTDCIYIDPQYAIVHYESAVQEWCDEWRALWAVKAKKKKDIWVSMALVHELNSPKNVNPLLSVADVTDGIVHSMKSTHYINIGRQKLDISQFVHVQSAYLALHIAMTCKHKLRQLPFYLPQPLSLPTSTGIATVSILYQSCLKASRVLLSGFGLFSLILLAATFVPVCLTSTLWEPLIRTLMGVVLRPWWLG